jgi:hypothetical protein
MKKIIKKYGHSFIIILDPETMEVEKLKVGDIVEIKINKIGKTKRRKKK